MDFLPEAGSQTKKETKNATLPAELMHYGLKVENVIRVYLGVIAQVTTAPSWRATKKPANGRRETRRKRLPPSPSLCVVLRAAGKRQRKRNILRAPHSSAHSLCDC